MQTPLFVFIKNAFLAPLLLILLCLAAAVDTRADDLREQAIPSDLDRPIAYLLETVNGQHEAPFNIEIVKPLIKFVRSTKEPGILFYPHKKFGGTAAYFEYEIDCDLEWILKLSYNPELPSPVTSPSTVRFSFWKDRQGKPLKLPELWQALEENQLPRVVRAIEHEAITPNAHTGAYYVYDQKRTLVLAKNDSHPVLISLARQDGPSEVGRKGAVLGADENWTYVYSNQKGLTKRGMGWLDSYMYNAASIIIFYQMDDQPGRIKAGVFKWLRAGWKNLNVVSREDIYEGIQRFAGTFKMILESSELQARYPELLNSVQHIQTLPEPMLREASRRYFESLVQRFADDSNLTRHDFDKLFVSREYLDQLTRREMESILIVEYLKGLLGKPQMVNVSQILASG